jgi:pimeloyl-ACP methyl ester carboxylesterase
MGDLRSTYRFVAPDLVSSGFTVVSMDLRGHGDSDASFTSYGDVATAGDLEALLDELGRSAVLVGNSMAAGSAVYLAATRPDLVSGLALLGPFVRDGQMSLLQKVMLRVAMASPWAAMSWKSYVPRLYAGRRPADYDAHLREVNESLRRPGYTKAFSLTTRTTHAPAEARLSQVGAATLVVMGELDPDFADPADEAAWIARQVGGQVLMVPEAGHYPQAQRPDVVVPALVAWCQEVTKDA